jgi:predicted transcriptional regulator
LIGFCKLADYCYRLNRGNQLDNERLSRFIETEMSKKTKNEQSLNETQERLQYLEGKDHSSLISVTSTSMILEAEKLKREAVVAQQEEEEALRVCLF